MLDVGGAVLKSSFGHALCTTFARTMHYVSNKGEVDEGEGTGRGEGI